MQAKATTILMLFPELRNAMRQPGDFAAGGIAMNDALLPSPDHGRFGFDHGGQGGGAIAARNRLLDLAQCGADPRPSRLIDGGAARDLASGLLG
jgi:hypothetical protein